jgi:STE24 endopeptidase
LGTLAVALAAEHIGRPGTTPVPAVLVSLAVIAPALTTVANQLSRAIERRADAFALDLTREPIAMISFERKITVKNVGDPDPPRWQQILLGTHPPTMERIGQAIATESRVGL